MNGRTKGYWATTGFFALVYTGSGVADLANASRVAATIAHLGYPPYLPTLLGIWKLLAVAALLAPRNARLKEWAYAGAVFDLTGAIFSHASVGDAAPAFAPPVVLLALLAASWTLRPASRVLVAPPAEKTSTAGRAGYDPLPAAV